MNDAKRPMRAVDITAQHFDDETLLLDGVTNHVCAINPTGGAIWELIDGRRTVAEIAAEVATATGADATIVAADVTAFVEALFGLGFVEFAGETAVSEGAWRRQVARVAIAADRAATRYFSEVRTPTKRFVPSRLDDIAEALRAVLPPVSGCRRLVALGCGLGAELLLAQALGYEAVGVEIDAELARRAAELAAEMGTSVRVVSGNFIPPGFAFSPSAASIRNESFADEGPYVGAEAGLQTCEVWVATPWPSTESVIVELFSALAAPSAILVIYPGMTPATIYRRDGHSTTIAHLADMANATAIAQARAAVTAFLGADTGANGGAGAPAALPPRSVEP